VKNKSLIYGIGILSILGFMVSHQKEEDSKKNLRQAQVIAIQKIAIKTPSPVAVLELKEQKSPSKIVKEKTIEAIAEQQAATLPTAVSDEAFLKEISGELEQVDILWQETLEAAYQRIKVSPEESAEIASMRQVFQEEYHSLDEQYKKATSRSRRDLLQMMSRDSEKKFAQHVQEFLGEDRFSQLQATREQFNQELDENTDLRPRVMSFW
jgi:hypothetical protein